MFRRPAMFAAAAILSLPATAAAQTALDRVVGPGARNEIIQAHEPFRSDGVLMLLPQIARATGVPMGFEVVKGGDLVNDGRAVPDAMEIDASHPLTGLPLRAALDLLVSLDPRYEWREMRDVIVVRPVEAWADARHVLHRLVSIDTDEFSLESALSYGTSLIDPPLAPSPLSSRSNRRFPLRLRVTVLEALNGLARGYGPLIWIFRPEGNQKIEYRHRELEIVPLDGEFPVSANWPRR